MKSMLMIAFVLILAIGSAFAEDLSKATTQTDCEKAGGAWNVQSNECGEASAKMGKEGGTHEGAHPGTNPEDETQKIDQPDRKDPTGN
jgi:opacity protein-like surface antigen